MPRSMNRWGTRVGLVSALCVLASACNPAREFHFDTRLYGIWQQIPRDAAATSSDVPLAPDVTSWVYLDINERGEVSLFEASEKSQGLNVLGRLQGGMLKLTDSGRRYLTERALRAQEESSGSFSPDSERLTAEKILKVLNSSVIEFRIGDVPASTGAEEPGLILSIANSTPDSLQWEYLRVSKIPWDR